MSSLTAAPVSIGTNSMWVWVCSSDSPPTKGRHAVGVQCDGFGIWQPKFAGRKRTGAGLEGEHCAQVLCLTSAERFCADCVGYQKAG